MKIKMILPVKSYDCIRRDIGARFAASLNMESITVKQLHDSQEDSIYILDVFLSLKELREIHKFREVKCNSVFLFQIVDPYPHSFKKGLSAYNNCIKWSLKYDNVGILSVYNTTSDLKKRLEKYNVPAFKCININYPYCPDEECSLDFDSFQKRNNKIIFSGATGSYIYKYRRMCLSSVERSKMDILVHSGYYANRLHHNIVGQKYIEHLSKYKFMFVFPSIFGLEFLKYSECAAAGCIPIGISPENIPKRVMVNVDKYDCTSWNSTIQHTLDYEDLDLHNLAVCYRKFFIDERSINSTINKILNGCGTISYSGH